MFKILFGAILASSFALSQTIAKDSKQLCHGFLPENDMRIPVGANLEGGITEAQFNAVLDRISQIYGADVERRGDTLYISRGWDDSTVNASAERNGTTEILNMYGGLARHPAVTVEGFALVACHEFGHHTGGFPKIPGYYGNNWATNEGGADYFGALKCLRRFFADDDNAAILKDKQIDQVVKDTCTSQFTDVKDQLICMRSSLAGQSVANLFQSLTGDSAPPTYDDPDRTQVPTTINNHPPTQCRLDTYFAGMTCQSKESQSMSDYDYRTGACYTPRDTIGFRPRCWFAPK
jgi:hypothetical protein